MATHPSIAGRLRASVLRLRPSTKPSRPQRAQFSSAPARNEAAPAIKHTNLRSQLGKKPAMDPNAPPPPPPFISGSMLVWIAAFTVVGFTAGKYVSSILAPAALPLPFSDEDLKHKSELKSLLQEMALVRKMNKDPNWESWEAYEGMDPNRNASRLTTGPLAAPGCIGHQRVFHNKQTDEYVVIVHLGKALAGWPGVVHGGLSATLLDECCGRAALARFKGGSGVTANLNFDYKKPVQTGGWWLIRAQVLPEEQEKRERKATVIGSVEDLEGNVHVAAKGIFVVPKGLDLLPVGARF